MATVTRLNDPLAAYPVGSVYMSVNSTSPETLFGGTWLKLAGGQFLRAGSVSSTPSTASTTDGGAASASYTPSGTNAGTAISKDQMPAHTHDMQSHTHGMQSHTHSLSSHTHTMAHTHGTGNSTCTHFPIQTGSAVSRRQLGSGGTNRGYNWTTDSTSSYTSIYQTTATGAASNATTSAPSNNTSGTPSNNTTTGPSNNTTTSTGGGLTHTHTFTGTAATIDTLPPYLNVNMWIRTA